MIKSMTGYGRGETSGKGKKWIIEIKSVNHRFLDISVKLPRSISLLEEKIKSEIKKKLARGRVEVYVKMQDEGQEIRQVKLDKGLVKAYYSALEEISELVPVSNNIKIMDLAQLPEVLVLEEQNHDLDSYWSIISEMLELALNDLVDMRVKEGQELFRDLSQKIQYLSESCKILKQYTSMAVADYQERIYKKIKEAVDTWDIDNNRVLTEVAIMVDKMSIDEEIVRIDSHLKQLCQELLSEEAVGRKLDFIIQELNREANTIGSKSSIYDISNLVVEIKTIIEKMREQVQNIE
ncbi:MAG: YicC/YloC family endoribonuclease [Bacillota bacterium]